MFIYKWTGRKLFKAASLHVNEIARKVTVRIQEIFPDFDPHTMKVKVTIHSDSANVEVLHLSSNLHKSLLPDGFIGRVSISVPITHVNQSVGLFGKFIKRDFNDKSTDTYARILFTELKYEHGYQLRRLTKQ